MGKPLEHLIRSDGADANTAFFFAFPFGVAGRIVQLVRASHVADGRYSLADEEEQIDSFGGMERLRR